MVLPPWIIEQIRKKEEERRREGERPSIRLPIPGQEPMDYPSRPPESDSDDDRGNVIIIELN